MVVALFVLDGRPWPPAAWPAVLQVAAFRAARCRLSRREKPHVAPRYVAFRVGESRGGFLRLCGMSVYPNNRITLNLTTVNAVRPLRGRYYLRIHAASSASLHMRLSNVGRLRRPATHCSHPKGLRMNQKSSPRRCAPRGACWFVVACGRLASVPCRHVFTLLQPSFRLRCRRPWPACRACRRRCPRLHRCRRWCKPSLCRQRSP